MQTKRYSAKKTASILHRVPVMLSYLVLIIAGLIAGALNAVAGGGTFLAFPALVWVGVPPIMANATSTISALPGYIGSTWAFRRELLADHDLPLGLIVAVAALGGIIGAVLLLFTPAEVFSGMVPWLLAFATIVFALGPRITAGLARRGIGAPGIVTALGALFLVTTYGGYFNGGVGILLLAALGLLGMTELASMNGLKSLMSSVLSLVSVVIYIAAGLIAWEHAIVLGLSCATGGYIAASLSRRVVNTAALRVFITLVGAVMTVIFFIRT